MSLAAQQIPNGKLTLRNSETGNHRTFWIKTRPTGSKFAPGARVIYLLTGPDNQSDYQGFAFLRPDNKISVWRKFRGGEKPSAYELFSDMIRCKLSDCASEFRSDNWEMMEVLWEARCLRCNRTLTDPESIKLGIGPECRIRTGGQ